MGFGFDVLEPGQPNGRYHGAGAQEGFLVLAGECVVEGEERPMKQWDYSHCPPWTEHIVVGAGPLPRRGPPLTGGSAQSRRPYDCSTSRFQTVT
jgi:hypothetical protein